MIALDLGATSAGRSPATAAPNDGDDPVTPGFVPGLVKLPGRLPGFVPWNDPTGRIPGCVVVVTGVIDGRLPGFAVICGELPLGREIDGSDGTLGSDDTDELCKLDVPVRERIFDFSPLSPDANSLMTPLILSG